MSWRRALVVGLAALVGMVISAALASASSLTAGALDPSYGSGGAVLEDFYGTQDPDQANAVAVQPDGKIVVAGSTGTGGFVPVAMVARYNANGSRDASFGPPPHGFRIQQVCLSGSCGQAEADAVAVMPNGDIVVAGVAVNNAAFFVMRLTPSGALDSSFAGSAGNPSGIDAFQLGAVVTGYHVGGVAVQGDGSIVVDGTYNSPQQGFIARVVSSGGALDTAGWNFPNGYTTEASLTSLSALTLQPGDGKAVAVGTDGTKVMIARFTSGAVGAGNPDLSFNASGITEAEVGAGPDTGAALVATTGGRLIVAATDQTGTSAGIGLFQFLQSNGALDTSFAGTGMERVALPGGDAGTATALTLDKAGKLVVAGQDTKTHHTFVARLSAAGALDGSFGTGGFSIPTIGTTDGAQAVTTDSAGNPVIAGFGTPTGAPDTDAMTARLLGSTPPLSGGGGGGGGGGPPGTAPILSHVAQTHATWREGPALAVITRATHPRHRHRAPIGTTFSFTLDESANISLVFVQQEPGRRVHGKCVVQTKRNKRKPNCRRHVQRATRMLAGHAGLNSVAFQGRLNPIVRLPLGRYTLMITATAAGKQSPSKSLSFTIVR